MLEVNLARRAQAVRPDARASAGPVKITLLPAMGRLSFRAKQKALAGSNEVAGFTVDGPMNSRRENMGLASLRLGPDEWMLLCEEGETESVVENISRSLDNTAHSLVDVSHRDVTFEVEGKDSEAVINSGCPIDLSLSAFPVGSATRTMLGKSEIVLARITETSWRVTCWRSFGTYVQGFLADAALDFA
ncbi:sarcosine oxidase subunit gamma family protein [Fulvimarina sp. MAC8]|uniref:sarcosine oxidase subunit gamma n=1 Tax=Fulvimarina sp. MAC8 TaxID=3162874 RepID=UPI0032EFDCC9